MRQTLELAESQLVKAKESNVENKSAIISAKQELRENTQHSIQGLWGSDGFEALAALSQYANPVIDKIADYEATEGRIAILENIIKSPYFARIDFKFEDDEVFEKIYIGRAQLMKDNSYEIFVYDWRSPVAGVFYRFVMGPAYYDSPGGMVSGELGLKRQYEINNGVLEYFFDADVQVIDEFLRKVLSQNTSTKMKTIVETIQKEQDTVIRDMENDLMMVQGVAGSGKTSVALHRAAYLMYQGLSSKLSANNIMIISPNSLFGQYISNVLPELGEDNVLTAVLEELLADILQDKRLQSRDEFLENLINADKGRDIMKASIQFKTSPVFSEILNRFIEDLPTKHIEFTDIYFAGGCIAEKSILKEKVLNSRKSSPLGVKLKQLEEYILELARGHENREGYQILKKEVQKFTELDALALFRKLFDDRGYFYALTEGLSLPNNIDGIFIYTQENLASDFLHYDDSAAIALFSLKMNRVDAFRHIKQVVVDEAQDYYPIHYEIFNLLFPNAKYTVLGDINQTLEKQEDISLYSQISTILNKKRATLVTMDKSFRSTNEIFNFSSKFIGKSIDVKSFNREGEKPKAYVFDGQNDFIDSIVLETQACLEKGYKSIGLICKTEKGAINLFGSLKDRVGLKLIKRGSTEDLTGVFAIPVYMSKGLEFDAVLVCDADERNYYTEDDKKLLYIACTRALHRLNLFCKGKISPLI